MVINAGLWRGQPKKWCGTGADTNIYTFTQHKHKTIIHELKQYIIFHHNIYIYIYIWLKYGIGPYKIGHFWF
jgi:hypothetical protein